MSNAVTSASINLLFDIDNKCILLVSDSEKTINNITQVVNKDCINILVAKKSKQALNLFLTKHIDYVIVDLDSIDMQGDELVYALRVRVSDNFIPIIVITSSMDEVILSDCMSAGSDDFFIKPVSRITIKTRLSALDQVHELKNLYKDSINEQLVAKQILAFALAERNTEFEEIKLLSRSKAVFSGDLFLTSKHPDGGLHVLLADFTGHGLSAAIGALPVADIFSVMTKKGFEIENILENLNNKLHTLLPVSMFMACIMLKINNDLKHVDIWNGGMPDIYVRDSETGYIKQKIRSLHIALGITESIHNQYIPETIATDTKDHLFIFSDGLIEAADFNGDMFGYEHLERCFEQHRSKLSIFPFLVDGFNNFCSGKNPDDDVTLACVPCTSKLTEKHSGDSYLQTRNVNNLEDGWCWYMELSGSSLRNINPVPIIMGEAYKIFGPSLSEEKLLTVINTLYDNAINHGLSVILGGGEEYTKDDDNEKKYLRIGLKKIQHNTEVALLISLEDSGIGFDHLGLMKKITNQYDQSEIAKEGIPLVYEISDSLLYYGKGNHVEAVLNVRL